VNLLTKELRGRLPPLCSQDGKGDAAIVCVKFFTPDSSWTWYVLEGGPVYDADEGIAKAVGVEANLEETDFLFFGLVDGHEVELGYFSLAELATATGPLGLHIERDKFWKPKTLGEVRAEISARHAA